MERLDPLNLAAVLASTSTSRIAGLLAADPVYKSRSAELLAQDIARRLNDVPPDRNQLILPL